MGGATDGSAPGGTGSAPVGADRENRPLVVCAPDGRPVGVLEENPKGFRKTIERGHLWALHPGTGRLLPFYEQTAVTIADRGTWYEAVLGEEVDAADYGAAGPEAGGTPDATHGGDAGPRAGAPSGDAASRGDTDGATRIGRVLTELAALVAERHAELPEGSYTTHLFTSGSEKIRKKTGEEAVELLLASTRETLTSETADLLYHLLVLLESEAISLDEVAAELERR